MSLGAVAPCLGNGQISEGSTTSADYESPYENVVWNSWEAIHSMSHQHQGTTDSSRELFLEMGYRHFAFSNYYPSAPTMLPCVFQEANPEITWAPNAEQHSFLDSGLHFNSLGSRLATGYGKSLSAAQRKSAPVECDFEGITVFDKSRPWEGVYQFDLTLTKVEGAVRDEAAATLTVIGANGCARRENFGDEGPVAEEAMSVGKKSIYLRASADVIRIELDYDPEKIAVTQCRLMQGTNRPWREVIQSALDGENRDGVQSGGLLHSEGGGITLNHPTGKMGDYIEMLDFDPRVLGIEVWNQLTSGFGSNRGFYDSMTKPPSHFYELWDKILASGRRCWGFFVKDHNTYGRGRNVLMVPPLSGVSVTDREANMLHAYRNGSFFGSVAAIACDEEGKVIPPYDKSNFRFQRIQLRRGEEGRAASVEVAVTGNDAALRPNVQIRFITEKGVVSIVDAAEGEFVLPAGNEDSPLPVFIRVEAFAYPDTHEGGKPLDAETVSKLAVAEISRLHNRYAKRGANFFGNPAELRTPIPVVDQIFSQPIRRIGG